jgi:hypothetical protein
MPRSNGRLDLLICPLLFLGALMAVPSAAAAHHRARVDPSEPIFTQRPFIEKDLELDVGWEKQKGSDGIELSPGVTWVFAKRLELGLEIPVGLQIPDQGATVGSLGDVAAAAQVLLCCQSNWLLDYFSLRADVEAPTGSRSKDIGGTGSWSVSLLPGRLFTVLQELPDLFVQAELTYAQEIRPANDEKETAAELGLPKTREKELDWNLAFVQPYLGGRLRPVFEVLGTSIVDAVTSGDEGTIVELAAGLWAAPFPDESRLSPLSLGMGWKWPVTRRKESQVTGLFVVEWSFGQ